MTLTKQYTRLWEQKNDFRAGLCLQKANGSDTWEKQQFNAIDISMIINNGKMYKVAQEKDG